MEVRFMLTKKRQETKMAMADAQHMHAKRMADGEENIRANC